MLKQGKRKNPRRNSKIPESLKHYMKKSDHMSTLNQNDRAVQGFGNLNQTESELEKIAECDNSDLENIVSDGGSVDSKMDNDEDLNNDKQDKADKLEDKTKVKEKVKTVDDKIKTVFSSQETRLLDRS